MEHWASTLWLSALVLLCGWGGGRTSGPPSSPPQIHPRIQAIFEAAEAGESRRVSRRNRSPNCSLDLNRSFRSRNRGAPSGFRWTSTSDQDLQETGHLLWKWL